MSHVAPIVLGTRRKGTFDGHFGWLRGEHFESAWSAITWTSPAHGTLFAGRYPSGSGVYATYETFTDDQLLYGIARPAGAYGWEGRAAVRSEPPIDHDHPPRDVEELRESSTVADVTSVDDRTVPADVEGRLAEPGDMYPEA